MRLGARYGTRLDGYVGMDHHGQPLTLGPWRRIEANSVVVSAQLLQWRGLSFIRTNSRPLFSCCNVNLILLCLPQVFDINQSLNISYVSAQLFLLYTPEPSLSQLLTEGTLATVLNSTSSTPVPPLDTLTNTLVSPLFYGLLSTSVSNAQGLAALTGVRVGKNLPGAWTLQCGVDGVMMNTPVCSRMPGLRDCSRRLNHF